MSKLIVLLSVIVVSLSVVPFKSRSERGNYQLKAKSLEAVNSLLDRVPGLKDKCTEPTSFLKLFCQSITKKDSVHLLQQDDLLDFIDQMKTKVTKTVAKITGKKFAKRSVPWNLDRLNQQKGVLDQSFRDDADVDVYILGSGIKADHSEFESRASNELSATGKETDCEGSGTELASLVGGRTMGVARNARLIGVIVIDCDRSTDTASVLRGISFIEESILKSDRRAVVLVGFTMDNMDKDINSKLVGLTELNYGSNSGVLVVVGAGDEDDLDSCKTTPASAQGETALNGVVSVGATDQDDATVSNIGECVDLFAPGADVPAAGIADATAKSSCSGSLCAAALAAGVIADSLRENSKADIDVQKSMLVNGATILPLTLPPDNGDFRLTALKAQTPQKLLYHACGYYKNEKPPTCEAYTASCNNSKVTTFDGNNVPIFQQKVEKCGFYIFQSSDNDVSIQGFHHKCTLGAYRISWLDNTLTLLPGPLLVVNSNRMYRDEIEYDSNDVSAKHELLDEEPREPLIVISLKRDGEEEIHITFDGTSRLMVTLVKFDKYNGKTGGLCGFYDNDGTNDYRLPDGSELSSYSTGYHEGWRTSHKAGECGECAQDGCPCKDAQCQRDAQSYCSKKFEGASDECLRGVNVYKERQACIEEVSKCCCQEKKDGNSSPDLSKVCCQNSYFGNFERNRAGCSFCDDPKCEKEKTHEHCVDNANGRKIFDYLESVKYTPEDCCYFLPNHDTQICTAPRNEDMMWNKPVPACQEKMCRRPAVPNDQTLISPDKEWYHCEERVTVTCSSCHEINPEPQIIQCRPGNDKKVNDAGWTEDVDACKIITCREPILPDIDDNRNKKYPLSWIKAPVPHGLECGDSVEFECDICYKMYPEDGAQVTCEENGRWTDSPRCRLRYCNHPKNPSLEYPLDIKRVRSACNDTIEYFCNARDDDPAGEECYDLEGSAYSTCKVDDDNSIHWDSDRPACNIRHCPQLTKNDIRGGGFYQYAVNSAEDEYKRIWLTDTGSNSPTECGSEVDVVCEECYYLCGPDKRTCLSDRTWGKERPLCQIRSCRKPENDENRSNAIYKPTKSIYDCGESVTFQCKDDCYEYDEGSEKHTCKPDLPDEYDPWQSKAKWDAQESPYSCKMKQCPVLDVPENGEMSTEQTSCGTIVKFSCEECYELQGKDELKCQSDKTWSDNIPTCVKKECPAPGVPTKGQAILDSSQCGAVVNYKCNKCYYLEGDASSECQYDRTWSNPIPKCTLFECEKRGDPENGWIENSNRNLCGDTVKYHCKDCYEMTAGLDSATCEDGGTWSNPEPTCSIKTCKRPAVPSNTQIDPDQATYNCGDKILVKCPSCYELKGGVDIHCLANENGEVGWEREVPGCGVKECHEPGPLKRVNVTEDFGLGHGELSYIVEKVDGLSVLAPAEVSSKNKCADSVEYECDICYNLKGNKKRYCQEDKTWTEAPVCELKLCNKPEELTEHLVLKPVRQVYSCKEPIQYSCDDECWELDGSSERSCKPVRGTNITAWYPEEPPTCYIKECLPLIPSDPLLIKRSPAFTCGSSIQFSCPPCFKLVGAPSARCTADEEWEFDGAEPQCVPVCCPPLSEVRSGDPAYDVITMTYNFTHDGDDEQKAVCGGDHVCQRVEVACQQCYEYKRGQESFDMAPLRECQHPGSWTNSEEICTRKSCPVRVPDSYQHIRYKDPAMESRILCGSEVELECKECYENLDGELQHTCLPNKQWSAPVPTCSLKECAELPIVDNHCTFPGDHRTCGSARELKCEDCYYTDKCKNGRSEDITVRCSMNKEWEWRTGVPVVAMKKCGAPPDFEHSSYVADGSDYSCGRLIRYECDECYEMEDPGDCNCAEIECTGNHPTDCSQGYWQGKFPKCLPKQCEPLEVPDHAHIIESNNGCLQKTQFECDRGYELVAGDLTRTCDTTKQWSGSPPICRIRNCTELQAPDNGGISTLDRHYGTVVKFSCDPCYKFPDSMTDAGVLEKKSVYPRYHILACEEHGNWNGSEPVCQKKYCGKPDIPGNADITSLEFYCGDNTGYTCDEGYYHKSGDSVTFCGEDQKWDGKAFKCEVKRCNAPREVADGSYSPRLPEDEYVYGMSVEYDCDYCHQSKQELTFTCSDSDNSTLDQNPYGLWTPNDLPKCTRIQCPDIKPGPNSKFSPVRNYLRSRDCSQILKVECDEGYTVRGRVKSLFCQSSGRWNTEVPQCQKKCCPQRELLLHGEVESLDDQQCYGDKVRVSCNTCYQMQTNNGYTRQGSAVHTCRADGTWSEELPSCRLIKCPSTPFDNGNFSDSSYSGYCGSERTFQCYSGYTISGTSRLICNEDGRWSGSVPTCEPNPCSAVGLDIENGDYWTRINRIRPEDTTVLPSMEPIKLTSYPLYTEVVFDCNEGFQLVGVEAIYCQEDGSWSDRPPRCSKMMCDEPPSPEHGLVSWNNLKEGGVASYRCNRCFSLEGYQDLTCDEGEWLPQQPPRCSPNLCYPPGEEPNSYIIGYDPTKATYSCGETVEYACEEGHKLHGVKIRTCDEEGRWTGSAPVCADIQCPSIEAPDNGGMRQANRSSYLEFWCDKGYQLSGSSYLLCVKGQWQGVEPSCSKQVCGDPGLPDWGSREGDSFEYGDSVSYSCDVGYQMRGAKTITCTHRGEWNYAPPYCVCNECPRLAQPPDGYIVSTDSNSYLSLVEYVCYPGFEVVGEATRTCLASGKWSGDAPRCERLNCTENFKVPVGGYVHSITGHKFEDIVEIKCPSLKGGYVRKCQKDGLWSGNMPERCDCRQEVRKVPVRRQIKKPASCILGRCHPETVWTVTVYEDREFSVCD